MRYARDPWRCEVCDDEAIHHRDDHAHAAHRWKYAFLQCPACDYQDFVVDLYRRHVQEVHPELSGNWEANITTTTPYTAIRHCPSPRCAYRFVTLPALDRHALLSHGLTPSGAAIDLDREQYATLPPSLVEVQFKFDACHVGYAVSARRQVIVAMTRPVHRGVFIVRRGLHNVGTLVTARHDSARDDQQPADALHHELPWPRYRAELLNTRTRPWSVTVVMYTKVDLTAGEYLLRNDIAPEHQLKMMVVDASG